MPAADVLGGDAEAQAVETLGGGQLDLAGQRHRGGVAGVVAGDAAQQQGAVVDGARERADLVERAGEGDQAVAATRRRRWASCRPRRRARPAGGWSRRCRSPGPRAPRRRRRRRRSRPMEPPGTVARSQGLCVGPEGRVLGGGAHGELVHVGLAEHDDVVAPDAPHGGRRVDRLVVAEDLRAAGRGDALGDHVVLDGRGQAGQGAARGAASPGRSRWRTWRRCRRSPG